MSDVQYVLTGEQREEISKAAAAIGECVKGMIAKPNAQVELLVIWTNLAIIQTNLANLPRVN